MQHKKTMCPRSSTINGSTRANLVRLLRFGTVGAFLAGIFSAFVPVAVSAATIPFTVGTSSHFEAFQHSAQDKVAYLHDGSMLVGYYDGANHAVLYRVTSPSTSPVSTLVNTITGGSEITLYTLTAASSTEIWVAVGSELTGGTKQEQVQYGVFNGTTITWQTLTTVPGSLTSGRQDPSVTWTGKWLIASWWDDTLGGNTDTVFYNWTTMKNGTSGWHVPAKSGTTASASAIKSGTVAAATLAGVTSITATMGTAPVNGDLFEFGHGTANSEIRAVTVSGTASPYTLTVTALGYAHAMGEVITTAASNVGATSITYAGVAPVVGDSFQIGTAISNDGTVACHSGIYNPTAPACDADFVTVTGYSAGTLTFTPALTNTHAVGEPVRIAAQMLTPTFPNSVQVSIRHSTKLGATIAVYAAHCNIYTRTLLDSATDPSPANWTTELAVDTQDDCEGNFGGPQIAIDESTGKIHVFKAVTTLNGPAWSGITYWLGTPDATPMSSGIVSWGSRVVIDSTGTSTTNPPDIAGAVDSTTGKVYVYWATSTTGGAIKLATLTSPYTSASAPITVPTTGTDPRYPHVPAQAPLTFGYVPLVYQTGSGTAYNIVLETRYPDLVAPSVPTGLSGTATATPQVNLTWNASTDAVGVTGSTLTYTDSTVAPATSYSYTVDAFDAAGNHSAKSAPFVISTADTVPPTVPGGLTTTASTTTPKVTLNWSASTDNVGVTGYSIYRGGSNTPLATVSGSTLTYADTTVVSLTNYSYTVDAFDAAHNHSAQSASSSVTTPDWLPPSVPGGVTATFVSSTPEVDVAWTGSTDNVGVVGYTIYRNGTKVTTVSGSTLTYVDTTIAIPANYSYTVDAFDAAANHSAQSTAATVGTVDTVKPSIPAGLSAATSFTHQVSLSWSASTDNVGVTGYTIYRNGSSIGTVSGSTLVYADTTVIDRTAYTYTVDAFDAAGNHSAQSAAVSVMTPDTSGTYHPLSPTRVLDTRSGHRRLGSRGSVTIALGGVTVPANATAVVLNVTATNTSSAGFFTVYPSGGSVPLASNLNWVAGKTVPNLVTVRLGAGGLVTIFNGAGSADAVVDLEGYYAPPGTTTDGQFVPLPPKRITDTRPGSLLPNEGSTLGSGRSLDVQITGAGGVPSTGVEAVVLNVTVTRTTRASFITAFPTGSMRPLASNLNWTAGVTVPNRVIVPVGKGVGVDGKVTFYNASGLADLIVDVNGYFTDATASGGRVFVGVPPSRILDTRYGTGGIGGRVGSGATIAVTVAGVGGVPAMGSSTPPKAVVINVTVTGPTAASVLTVWPSGTGRPNASDVNFVGGQTVANLVVVQVGSDGKIGVFNGSGATYVVIDIVGWYG
jgi:chitodextrinase